MKRVLVILSLLSLLSVSAAVAEPAAAAADAVSRNVAAATQNAAEAARTDSLASMQADSLAAAADAAAVGGVAEVWKNANDAYLNGDYATAAALYESILDRGLRRPSCVTTMPIRVSSGARRGVPYFSITARCSLRPETTTYATI